MATKKSKGVRLFKVLRELNVARDTLVQHLTTEGYKLEDTSPNARLSPEMYEEALRAFAAEKQAAERHERRVVQIRKKQQAMTAEGTVGISDLYEPEETAESSAPAPTPEPPSAPDPVEAQIEDVVDVQPAEEVEVPVEGPPDIAVEEAAEPTTTATVESPTTDLPATPPEDPVEAASPESVELQVETDVTAPVEETVEAEVAAEVVVEAPAAVETETVPSEPPPVATSTVEAPGPEMASEPEVAVADEAEDVEAVEASEEKAPDTPPGEASVEAGKAGETGETGEQLVKADRYELSGPKVVGSVNLSELPDDARSKRRRKRKRKKKGATDAPPTETATTKTKAPAEDEKTTRKRKRKRKRLPQVDEGEVAKNVQQTLSQIGRGTSRTRQRRKRARREEQAAERQRVMEIQEAEEQTIRVMEYISANELASQMGVSATDVVRVCLDLGMMVSINQRLDADTITLIADEFNFEVEFITDLGTEDIEIEEDAPEDLEPRASVVTVMGHVDHGKTSLLDYIRNTNVVAGESGGITQHIGAYSVELPGEKEITFLDTPGHEAFTAMRARGAQVTDIVILVVAADDAVMPQTIEAINHARAAQTPLVVAINKIDKPSANSARVMQELADQGVLVEQYGGQVQCVLVSAHTGEGIDDLMEKVLLEAEVLELTANADRLGIGTVIESRLDKGRGIVATVLVQNGTLSVGDTFVAGAFSGRVRALFDERDRRLEEIGPSEPALVLGFGGQPEVGDQLVALEDERDARTIAQKRQQIYREQQLRQRKHIALEDISRRMALGELQELKMIVKGDVGGSVEALTDSLMKLSTEEVSLNIIHTGVGAITESDVMLASASDAIILGFQVRPVPGVRKLAEREEIELRMYSIIYDAIEDVRDALEGMLSPELSEKALGLIDVREIFKVPKVGTIAGCYVLEGKVRRNDKVHLIRDGVVIYDGKLASLKRFKDDVREVQSGYECGLSIENYNDIKIGDQLEVFEIVETRRTLEA